MKIHKKKLNKVDENKRKKEELLYKAAYDLFTTKGINNTAIDDIVKKAGVAKGTFYLYFKDKYDITDRIILKKSSILIMEAVNEMKAKELNSFEDKTLYFIDYIIKFFEENKLMLKIINKNFSWGLYRKALMKPEEHKELDDIASYFINTLTKNNITYEDAEITLYMIFELIGSVCYSSIILEEPVCIDKIKPILFKKIILLLDLKKEK